MQSFTTNSSPMPKKENYFLSQPHQPFFIAGIIWAVIVMLIFMASYKILLKGSEGFILSPSDFHSYSLIFIVLTQFFIGFLFTTFSKFCQSEPVQKNYYLRTFILYQVGSILFCLGFFISEPLMLAGMGILLLGQGSFLFALQKIFKSSIAQVKNDPLWILLALYIGTAGHFAWIIETLFSFEHFSLDFIFNLYLVFMTFSVAQRMVPFFSHSLVKKQPYFLLNIFTALFFKSVTSTLGLHVVEAGTSLLIGIYILYEIIRWKLSFRDAPAILKILHLALFWMPLSLIIGAISELSELYFNTDFIFVDKHLLALGFVTTILVGFGTRVALGHSGQPPHADKNTLRLFYLTQILVGIRLIYSLVFGLDLGLLWLFDLSVTLWLLLFIFWGWKFGPILVFGSKKS